MAINRIYHQHFGEFHPKADRALKVFSPVFYEVLRFMDAFLDLLGLRFETSLDQRWSASVRAHRVIAIMCSSSQRENRNGIAIVEPKGDRRFELRSSRRCLGDSQNFRRRLGIGLWNVQSMFIIQSCQNATPIKRLWSTSKKRQNPSRSRARTLLNPRTSSASSARPRNGYASQSASNRSSSLERFGSRFFDRFTFFSVSVTPYPRLPSGFRPAPFRFPPLLFI